MKRCLLVVAYDGTDFHGYQIQPEARTVEGVLNKTLSELLGAKIVTVGASRTDAGVHAYGNIAVFDTETAIPPEKLCPALNTKLPEDIRIIKSLEVDSEFHPRKDVLDKTYEYRLDTAAVRQPTRRRYTCPCRKKPDVRLMRRAAVFLEGEHDFTSFCSAKTDKEDKVRRIFAIAIKEAGEEITISVRGNGFLYNMVRIIAGTLLEVGEGKIPPEKIKNILEGKNRSLAGRTLPPQGLFLKEIRYEGRDKGEDDESLYCGSFI